MYYRINKVSFDADKYDSIMAAVESKRELFKTFEGLQNSRIVQVSETEAITIAEYDTKENLENSKTEFAEMMKDQRMIPEEEIALEEELDLLEFEKQMGKKKILH